MGIAILASDLLVFRKLLTDRENVLPVDPEDSVKFAEVLTKLARDADLQERPASWVRAGLWRAKLDRDLKEDCADL